MNIRDAGKAREELEPERNFPQGKTMTPAKTIPDGRGMTVSVSRAGIPEGARFTVTVWIMGEKGEWEMGGQFRDRGGVRRRRDGTVITESEIGIGFQGDQFKRREIRVEIDCDRPIRARVQAE